MKITQDKASEIRDELLTEVKAIQIFSTSVIFSAVAVASSTVLLFIPNFETLSLFFFIVGYRYGTSTGTTTVITSVTIYEMFASQVYGTGGLIPFLLKFPPFFLIMFAGVYFHHLKTSDTNRLNPDENVSRSSTDIKEISSTQILYRPPTVFQKDKETHFSLYEWLLLAQLGLVLTMIYDVITTFGILVFVPTWEGLFLSFITGLPFFIFHQITNCILFSTIPSIIMALDKARPMT